MIRFITGFKAFEPRPVENIKVKGPAMALKFYINSLLKLAKSIKTQIFLIDCGFSQFLILSIHFGSMCILKDDKIQLKKQTLLIPNWHFQRLANNPYFYSCSSTHLITFLCLNSYFFVQIRISLRYTIQKISSFLVKHLLK